MVMNRPWTLLTVFFSHELHIHILLNMFLVLIFGTQLERETNAIVVFYVYLLSGFIGSLTILAYAPLIGYDGEPIPGASAAAFGIVTAYAALQPNKIILKSKSKYWMIALFIVNAVLTIQNPHVSVGGPAHAAGIVVGLIFGYLLKKKVKSVKNNK
jgi:membrane associated rhomboid family serine protease